MNKSDLADKVAKRAGISIKDANAAINGCMATIKESLSQGETVTLIGFGSFLVRDRSARQGHNPRNGEVVEIPAVKLPAFKAGKLLKDAVNKN